MPAPPFWPPPPGGCSHPRGHCADDPAKAVAVLVSVGEWEDYLRLKAATETHGAGAAGQKGGSGQDKADSGNGRG